MTKSPVSSLKFSVGHWSLVICHLSFVICLAACARPDDTWDRVRETGVLRVGMDASFPPFEAIAADGTLVGFDVDLARELGRRLGPALPAPPVPSGAEGSAAEGSEVEGPALPPRVLVAVSSSSLLGVNSAEGVEVQFVANLPYDGLYDALAVGRVDVVISALVVNPARMADFAYSTPYFDAGQVLVVREKPVRFLSKGLPCLSRAWPREAKSKEPALPPRVLVAVSLSKGWPTWMGARWR